MTEAEIFEALDAARNGLRACLDEFQSGPVADPLVGRAFSEVQRAVQTLGDLEVLSQRVDASAHQRLRTKLEELLRLNALLTASIAEERIKVGALLKHSQQGLRTMNAISRGPGRESTCDVSA